MCIPGQANTFNDTIPSFTELIYVDKTTTPGVSWIYLRFHLFFKDGKVTETGKRSKKDIAQIIVTEGAILLNSSN